MEENAVPFERQRYSSRVVDPTGFDWPAPHWRKGSMPDRPLAFDRGPASAVANVWQEAYNKELRDNEYLTVESSTRFVRSLLQPDGSHAVLFERDQGDSPVKLWAEFAFVLNCTGPGVEDLARTVETRLPIISGRTTNWRFPTSAFPRPIHSRASSSQAAAMAPCRIFCASRSRTRRRARFTTC